MRVILDQNFPRRVAAMLRGHSFETTYRLGWAELENGTLLAAAEEAGFEAMLTADRRIRYQQNLAGRRIALVVTSLNSRSVLMQHVHLIQAAVGRATPGSYEDVHIRVRCSIAGHRRGRHPRPETSGLPMRLVT